MKMKELQSTVEAVLFAAGEPLELSRLSQALELDELLLSRILENLAAKYDEEDAGICLLRMEDRYQLCSRREYADAVRKVLEIKRNAPLSQAAFEVLAIVAYNQPVTKAFIEQIRGVDCSAVLATLTQKALIEERGRLDLPGRPLIYGTTPNFLRCFCVSSLEELPALPERTPESGENSPPQGEEPTPQEEKSEKNENDFPQKVDES